MSNSAPARESPPAGRRTLRVDMHVHTACSHDGYLTLEALEAACRRRSIAAVVIADHNEIEGALRAAGLSAQGRMATRIIVAEEVSTAEGEIIGLFLTRRIPPGMSMVETIRAIRNQGGLVYLNHPFGYSRRRGRLNLEAVRHLWGQIDAVEIFNGHNMIQQENMLAVELARAHGKPGGVGTDAHSAWEVGRSFVRMSEFNNPETFLASLANATYRCRPCPVAYRAAFRARKMLWPRPRALAS
jgi:predicted metal-dependent phosphoesterase TrpH